MAMQSSVWDSACVRAPNWVGDVVMATPALRALRQALPEAWITLVVKASVEPVLRCAPWFSSVVRYDPRGLWAAKEFLGCIGALRPRRFELGLVLPNSFSSALMFFLAGVDHRVGYQRDARSALLSDAVPRPSEEGQFKPTYMVDYYLALCERVGIRPAGRQTELFFVDADLDWADAILQDKRISRSRPIALLHAGAGYGPSKQWPAERFARLARLLKDELDAQVAVIGPPSEAESVQAIQQAGAADVSDLTSCGIDLHLLKCIVKRSDLLVTTDSGPRHYGVALGVPTICVMGPTHPGYSTSALPHDIVVRLDTDCGPCQQKSCPRDHKCMHDITADMVFEACWRALEGRGTRA